jgi:hypothetical protein
MSNPGLSNCHILLCFWDRTPLTIVRKYADDVQNWTVSTPFTGQGRRERGTMALLGTLLRLKLMQGRIDFAVGLVRALHRG